MKRLVLLFLTTMIVSYTMAQQQITISEIAGGGRLKHSSAIGTVITSVDKFDTKQNIDLKPDPYIVAGITYKLFDPSGNDITQTIQGQKINGIASGPILKLEVKLNGFTYSIPDIGKNLSATPVTSTPGGTTKSTSPTPSFTASGYFQGTSFPAPLADLNFMKTGRRYFSGADRAAIILDEKGKLIGP